MSAEPQSWRVAIVDLNAVGLFLLERLSLAADIRIQGVFDQDCERRKFAANLCCRLEDRSDWTTVIDDVDAIFFMGHTSVEELSTALDCGKHVVIGHPWSFTSAQLFGLADHSSACKYLATYVCLHRWSSDFVAASHATNTGRLGTLRSVRFSSCERRLPGEVSSANVLREILFHLLDQLLVLVKSTPQRVFAKRFAEPGEAVDRGLVAVIEFANGCTAQIDLQFNSRFSQHTGWMLEGSTGSYRNDRLYTVTADGEIVDELLPIPPTKVDPFVPELVSDWQGVERSLPTFADAARVVELVEAIEQSSDSRAVLQM